MTRGKLASVLMLAALMAVPAAAGPLEDGQAAYDHQDYKTAAQDFMVAASQGDDNARAHLGVMFVYGIGVPQDGAQAVFWLSLAAEHNNAEADTALGQLYLEGRFVKADPALAAQFFTRGANQGMALAQASLGELYLSGKGVKLDYAAAQNNFGLAAKQNDARAQYDLGFMFYTGLGVKQNYAESVNWFTKSADQGNAGAATFLGTEYDKGLGVPQDNGHAIYYFRVAAVQGNLQGLGLLGEKYATGQGVPQDNQRAYLLLNISASQVGSVLHDAVIKQRDAVVAKLSQAQIDAAQKLGAFCTASTSFAVCLDDSVPVAEQAADPQSAFNKLRARIQAANPQTASAAPAAPAARTSGKPEMAGNGTGFFVSADGYLVTAAHVTKECADMRSGPLRLKLIAQDAQSDVALVSTGQKSPSFVKLRGGRGPRVGEPVVVVGYPLQGVLGEDQIVTTGIVSSLAGLQNDRRQIQISAPIQPGNSGGPVVGEDGALLGVAVETISTMKAAQDLGAMPQNVNFASSVGTLQSFLNAHQVSYELTRGNEPRKSSADLAAEAQHYTLMIECWQ